METASRNRKFTALLTNRQLTRLVHTRIGGLRRFTNRSQGEHRSGRSGQSTEFCDYRDYTPGDDIRYVDWNIFARLRRPYLKLFLEEERTHVVLLIDASDSMRFEEKLPRALQLAAAFGAAALAGAEAVSAAVINGRDAPLRRMPACTGRASMQRLFAFLEETEPGGDAPLETGIDALLREHRGRGIVVVLSDYLTTGDLRRSCNALFSRGLEIFGLQILGPTEIDPDVSGDLRLIDCETADQLDISSAPSLLSVYQDHRMAYARQLERLCRQRGGRFMATGANEPLDEVLFDQLRRTGWLQ